MAKKSNEYKLKRPRRADYIEKYGFEGDAIWRLELLKYEEAKNSRDKYEASLKAQAKRAKEEDKAHPAAQRGQKSRSTNVAKVQSEAAAQSAGAKVQSRQAAPTAQKSAPSFTVVAGSKSKTFATKKEAKAYEKAVRGKTGKPHVIRESTRKPTHRVVSFTAKK